MQINYGYSLIHLTFLKVSQGFPLGKLMQAAIEAIHGTIEELHEDKADKPALANV